MQKYIGREKRHTTQFKQTRQVEEKNQKVLAKEGILKKYQYWIKQDKRINEIKSYHQVSGEYMKTYPQSDGKRSKIWEVREHSRKDE